MVSSKSLGALIALAAGLSACNGGGQMVKSPANRTVNSVNQPVVDRTDLALDVTTTDAGLPDSERNRLRGWFSTLELGYGDHVYVDGPVDGRARLDIARTAAEFGLLLSDGAPVTAGDVQPGSARVIVSRSTATVPGCPNWEPHYTSATASNYGCAINSNLAAMVADPTDLVLGQTGSGTDDGATAAKAIKVYREKQPTGTKDLPSASSRSGN